MTASALAPSSRAASSGSTSSAPVRSAPATRVAPRAAPSPGGGASPASPRGRSGGLTAFSRPAPAPASAPAPRPRYTRPPAAAPVSIHATGQLRRWILTSYHGGLQMTAKADAAADRAARSPDAETRELFEDQARLAYGKAAAQLERATDLDEEFHEAWNELGYARRRAGDLEGALAAYDRCLELAPGYGPAIEYRAEAHLALGMFDHVRRAYLGLRRDAPELADQLRDALEAWLARNRGAEGRGYPKFRRWIASLREG